MAKLFCNILNGLTSSNHVKRDKKGRTWRSFLMSLNCWESA